MGKLIFESPRMKEILRYTSQNLFRIPAAVQVGVALLALSSILNAQSVDVFLGGKDIEGNSNAPGEGINAASPSDTTPSRFASKDIEGYVSVRAAAFSMLSREKDPFGVNQDPDIKPVVPKVIASAPTQGGLAVPATPLADIVKLIRVTTIMPGERTFLVGSRSFRENDDFSIVFQGKTLTIKVVEVTPNRILFRDIAKGEEAALVTGILPPGMIINGGEEMRPPGIVAPVKNIPLQLDSSSPQDN